MSKTMEDEGYRNAYLRVAARFEDIFDEGDGLMLGRDADHAGVIREHYIEEGKDGHSGEFPGAGYYEDSMRGEASFLIHPAVPMEVFADDYMERFGITGEEDELEDHLVRRETFHEVIFDDFSRLKLESELFPHETNEMHNRYPGIENIAERFAEDYNDFEILDEIEHTSMFKHELKFAAESQGMTYREDLDYSIILRQLNTSLEAIAVDYQQTIIDAGGLDVYFSRHGVRALANYIDYDIEIEDYQDAEDSDYEDSDY